MQIKFAVPSITDSERREMNNFLLNIQQGHNSELTHGRESELFGREFLYYIDHWNNFPEAVCIPVSSCMAALHLSYLALGIKQGDEVIVPAMSHVATAHAIEHVGAIPVFVDCDHNGNIDDGQVERAITRKTKAITLVHFLGTPCNMYRIRRIADEYGLKIVEDCALAIGSKFKVPQFTNDIHVGLMGDFGCFSFYPCKSMTTGEGGMLVCSREMAFEVRKYMQFGKKSVFDGVGYEIDTLGLNYRMDEMSAVLGREQLRRLQEEKWIEKRYSNAKTLHNILVSKGLYSQQEYSKLGNYALNVKFNCRRERDTVYQLFLDNNVGCSIYYPRPIPAFEYYIKKYGYQKIRYPMAEEIAYQTLALPIGPHIGEKEIDYMVDVLFKE